MTAVAASCASSQADVSSIKCSPDTFVFVMPDVRLRTDVQLRGKSKARWGAFGRSPSSAVCPTVAGDVSRVRSDAQTRGDQGCACRQSAILHLSPHKQFLDFRTVELARIQVERGVHHFAVRLRKRPIITARAIVTHRGPRVLVGSRARFDDAFPQFFRHRLRCHPIIILAPAPLLLSGPMVNWSAMR